ncbi:MAG: peptidoglycan recognition family protein [bacterium]
MLKKFITIISIFTLVGCSTPVVEEVTPENEVIPEDDFEVNDECCDHEYHELLLSYVFIDVVNLNSISLPNVIQGELIFWENNGEIINSLSGNNVTYYVTANIGNSKRNFNVTFENNKVKQIYQQDLVFNYYFINDSRKLGTSMNPTSIVIHNTANTASAYNEIMYLNSTSNTSSTSYHYAVDDIGIYQGIPNNVYGHHAGNLAINQKSIGIEIAKSLSTDNIVKDKAIYNAQRLIRLLQMEYNIENIMTHYDASGKHCPHDIIDRYGLNNFYVELKSMYNKV